MYCVFCQADDLPALWAYRGLQRRGLAPLEIFTPEALVYNRRLEHRLHRGGTFTWIKLSDGRMLDGSRVQGVLNRLTYLPVDHFHLAEPEDRTYAGMEQRAIFLSWMYSLPGVVINRSTPRGLCGDPRSPGEWAWLAGQAGLPALPFHQSDDHPVEHNPKNPTSQLVVLDGRVYGATMDWCDDYLRSSIQRLAELSGLRLLGLDFISNPAGEPRFVTATVLPDLQLGGDALLDALMAEFA